ATIGALSPFWLAESQETRMYTVGFALLMGAALALLEAWRRVHLHDGWRFAQLRLPLVAFVLLSALSLLTHYNVVFILVAWYLGWGPWTLLQPAWRKLLLMPLGCGIAMTLLVAPIAPIAMRQIPVYANPNLVVPSVA